MNEKVRGIAMGRQIARMLFVALCVARILLTFVIDRNVGAAAAVVGR